MEDECKNRETPVVRLQRCGEPMTSKVIGAVMVVMIQLLAALAVLPAQSGAVPAEIGTLVNFANGNSQQDFLFPEKGDDGSLSFRIPANSTVLNATFKVTGSFLGGTIHVDHTNDTPAGWGGDGNNQPEYNNTTTVDTGEALTLHLSQLGPLNARKSYGAGSTPTGVAVGDINNDGKNEVLVCNYANNNISVYTTSSTGDLKYSTSYSTSTRPWHLALGDLNNDDLIDVAVACGGSSATNLDVLTQKSDGTLNAKSTISVNTGTSNAYFVDVGDINNDGEKDLVITDEASKTMKYYFQNTTSGGFDSGSFSTGVYPSGVAIGNLVSHSGNEVALFDKGNPYYYYYSDPTLRVLEQSSGSLATHASYTLTSWNYDWYHYTEPYPVAVGDITGDGSDDIAFCWYYYSGGAFYLSVYPQSSGDIGTRVDYTNGVSSPRDMVIGDINADGKNELLLANNAENKFAIYNQTSAGKLFNQKSMNTGKKPTGIAIGDINQDGMNDVVTADGTDGTVSVFLQPPWFNGTFISRAYTAPRPNEYARILAARPTWNITANGQLYSVFLSNDGRTWYNVTGAKGQWLDFPMAGSGLKYMIHMNSTRATVSPKVLDFSLDYKYGTDPKDILIDVGAEGEIIEYQHPGFLNGSEWVNDFSSTLNQWIGEHLNEKDQFGFIAIPIYFSVGGMGRVTFSNITIRYDRPPNIPVLLGPGENSYVGIVPTFRILCFDPDNDTLKYFVQLSETRDFAAIFRTLDMTQSTAGWTKAEYASNETAVYNTPPGQMFQSGKNYYWRARVFDGTLWSDWSRNLMSLGPGYFSIDSVAPEAAAASPQYSKQNDFDVTWGGQDPAPGSGLIANPFDVQVKIDDGEWTDWVVGTSQTMQTYSGEPGHTYYFRARATDIAGNRKIYSGGNGDTATTIDPNVPASAVKRLPEYQTTVRFTVEWTGTDGIGGSGIVNYDVAFRDGGGQWTDWLSGTTATSAEFEGQQGHVYRFQARSRDRAGNLEEYPGGEGDARTAVDTTPPSGTVVDDGTETPSAISLHATLVFTDAESDVAGYEYRVGTSREGSDVMRPTAAADADLTISGLNLSVGPVYYIGARARNRAGLWGPWASTDGISVGAGANTATVSYASGMQNDPLIKVTLGGSAAGGVRIIDGDLEVRRATYYRGELGTWSNWMEVGQNGGDLASADYGAERGMAYQFRYRIKSEYNVWSGWAEPGTTLRINAGPVAVGGTDASAEAGKKVPFDATRSWDPDGDAIASYLWDFGDGKTDTKGATAHSWKKAGIYTVTLTVSDGSLNSTVTQKVRIRSPGAASTPGFEGALALLAAGAVLVLVAVRRKRRA
jgi:hypothetical protein